MVIRSFNDLRKAESDSEPEDKETDSYVGGEKSGLAVKNPKNKVLIIQYPNGIRVNDGAFMSADDPATQAFLKNLASGEVPEELKEFASKTTGELSVEVRREQEPYAPKVVPKSTMFTGTGQTLSAGASAATAAKPPAVAVDETKPVTTIQVRWPTGARLAQRFNENATVAELFEFLREACQGQAVSVSAGFPPAQLQPSALTISAAGLSNSAITVRIANQ